MNTQALCDEWTNLELTNLGQLCFPNVQVASVVEFRNGLFSKPVYGKSSDTARLDVKRNGRVHASWQL